jgi:hypothetical protein
MAYYKLKIRVEKNSSEISFQGQNLDCSGLTDLTWDKTRSLANLYYRGESTEESEVLVQEVQKLFPWENVKHYQAEWASYLRSLCKYTFQNLMPKNVADAIKTIPPRSIIRLEVDDSISHVPWELMHTGSNFLCLEHVLGRISPVAKVDFEPVQSYIPMLMVSDPQGDLMGSRNEANYIIAQMRGSTLRISRYGTEIKKSDYLKFLRSGRFRLIHYSGHSGSSPEPGKSCHVFSDDYCYAYEIEATRMNNPPFLVFSNSCQSAEGSLNKDETGNTSLAGAYLKAGVGACVGTIWTVLDAGSSNFASDFYRYILFGSTIGEALLNARKVAFKRWGYNDIIWGSYILFGNPDIRLVKRS